MDFEADLIIKTIFSDLKINEISFYDAIKILQKIGFRSGPYNKNYFFRCQNQLNFLI